MIINDQNHNTYGKWKVISNHYILRLFGSIQRFDG